MPPAELAQRPAGEKHGLVSIGEEFYGFAGDLIDEMIEIKAQLGKRNGKIKKVSCTIELDSGEEFDLDNVTSVKVIPKSEASYEARFILRLEKQ